MLKAHYSRFLADPERLHFAAHSRVDTDLRGGRIRFGFGLYCDSEDVDRLLDRFAGIQNAAKG